MNSLMNAGILEMRLQGGILKAVENVSIQKEGDNINVIIFMILHLLLRFLTASFTQPILT